MKSGAGTAIVGPKLVEIVLTAAGPIMQKMFIHWHFTEVSYLQA